MGALSPVPRLFFRDPLTDLPLAGGKLFTYLANTLTPASVYTTAAETVPFSNPVILDSSGGATIYLDGSTTYDFLLKRSDDTTVYTVEDVFAADTAYIQALVTAAVAAISIPAATTALSGIVELATSAEAIAGTDTVRAITPAALAAALAAVSTANLAGGEVTINGLVLKWGNKTVTQTGNTAAAAGTALVTGSSVDTSITFTTAFPTACAGIIATMIGDNGTGGQESCENVLSATAFAVGSATVKAYRLTGTNSGAEQFKFFWFAVGY
jgi:hypothetical protein